MNTRIHPGIVQMKIDHFIVDNFGLNNRQELYERTKDTQKSLAKATYYLLLKIYLGHSAMQTARKMGVDHTSVLYHLKRLKELDLQEELMNEFESYKPAYESLKLGIRSEQSTQEYRFKPSRLLIRTVDSPSYKMLVT